MAKIESQQKFIILTVFLIYLRKVTTKDPLGFEAGP